SGAQPDATRFGPPSPLQDGRSPSSGNDVPVTASSPPGMMMTRPTGKAGSGRHQLPRRTLVEYATPLTTLMEPVPAAVALTSGPPFASRRPIAGYASIEHVVADTRMTSVKMDPAP